MPFIHSVGTPGCPSESTGIARAALLPEATPWPSPGLLIRTQAVPAGLVEEIPAVLGVAQWTMWDLSLRKPIPRAQWPGPE